jgi:hypothetical protein
MHALRGDSGNAPRWRLHQKMFERAVYIVQTYYLVTLFMLYARSREMALLDISAGELDPLWPVLWLDAVGVDLGGPLMAHLALAAGLLGLVFWRFLWVRILVSIALLQFVALKNSFGSMGHAYHAWFWLSVAFWLLPSCRLGVTSATRLGRMRFLLGFSMAPAVMLLFYSLSGAYKVFHSVLAVFAGKLSGFSPDAMAVTLAWRSFDTGSDPLWASFIIGNPLIGWPLFLGLYYVELFALVVLFRPVLHQLWGLLLIGFHVGTLLFMGITFPEHVLINGLFMFMSPFALGAWNWRRCVAALPGFGLVFRAALARSGTGSHDADG